MEADAVVMSANPVDMTTAAAVPDCSSFCNITRTEWCPNLIVGLRTLGCSTQECVNNLCKAAVACEKIYQDPTDDGLCPTVFDGWKCINETVAGSVANVSCPKFDRLNFHTKNFASRICDSNGTWWDPSAQRPFTNYTLCLDKSAFEQYDQINKVYIAGYTISLTFLMLATIIFLYFRSLRCVRNTIHTHLFVASILHNVSWIIWYCAVIYRMDTIYSWTAAELWACKLLHIAINYFTVATYMWMLCEGLYLFVVLIVTFVSETRVMIGLYSIGWGLPFVVIAFYALSRQSLSSYDSNCWIEEMHFNWIYKVPCITSVFVNLIFLIFIVYVLVSKLHSDMSDHAAMVKTARAIGVLIPLFGLHNFLSAFKPDDKSPHRVRVEVISAIAISFQGMIVAILFCLINSEVIMQLKKFCGDHIDSRNGPQSMAMTQYTIHAKATMIRLDGAIDDEATVMVMHPATNGNCDGNNCQPVSSI